MVRLTTKQEAKSRIIKYFGSENIEYRMLNDTGEILSLERLDTIYLSCTITGAVKKMGLKIVPGFTASSFFPLFRHQL